MAPGCPHHVTQRGNRRQKTFFGDDDYRRSRELLTEGCTSAGVEVWAYCLMPNHVHLVPQDADGLRAGLGEAHRRYTRMINARKGWTGYLWQGRFAFVVMDESHLMTCVRLMLSKTPSGRGWLSGPAIGAGRVRERIFRAAMMDWFASGLC